MSLSGRVLAWCVKVLGFKPQFCKKKKIIIIKCHLLAYRAVMIHV